LKYGARLINSYLGNNSTISCCEVLNSLIFPFHEQHHNNSFLCAALLKGQTNIAAGATIGSNHNSRSADGEVVAGRGFWPGLCVSLKHNSRFGSFAIIAKGDYPAELNIELPFSLVSNDVPNDTLVVMPGYWFMYNMYALARNSWKYADRDKRTEKKQLIEYDFLAPDTINEIINALDLFSTLTGEAWKAKFNGSKGDAISIGRDLLEKNDPALKDLEILAYGFENTSRRVKLIKVPSAYHLFKELVRYYAGSLLTAFISENKIKSIDDLISSLPKAVYSDWQNVGGQLLRAEELDKALNQIRSGKLKTWEDIHDLYLAQSERYPREKLSHALAALKKVSGLSITKSKSSALKELLQDSISTLQWMVDHIYQSREKDYTNPFRMMVYGNEKEMDKVVGSLDDNPFIRQEKERLTVYKRKVNKIIKDLKL
jgi:hypothetical protein